MVDSITSAGKKLFSNKERAKRLAKSDRIKREKKGLPFMGSKNDPSSVTRKGEFKRKKKSSSVVRESEFERGTSSSKDTRREGEFNKKKKKKSNITPAQEKKFKSLFFVK